MSEPKEAILTPHLPSLPKDTVTSRMPRSKLPVEPSMGDMQRNIDPDTENLMSEENYRSLNQKKRRLTGVRQSLHEDVPPKLEKSPGYSAQGSKLEKKFQKLREKDKQSDSINQNSNFLTLGMLVALSMVLLAMYMYHREPLMNTSQNLFDLYETELGKMRTKYVNQSTRFWTTFLSSLEPILTTDDPDLPAVIMLAVPTSQHSMGLCFAEHLAEVLNKLFVDKNTMPLKQYLDSSSLINLGEDEQKVKIDEIIKKIIVENKQRMVIVDQVEKLHPKSVIIFHGYCDNSEAVFKHIAIVFLLEIPTESNFSSDEEVYAYLFKLWDELGPGKTQALLSRMANNVAIMQKVDHFIC